MPYDSNQCKTPSSRFRPCWSTNSRKIPVQTADAAIRPTHIKSTAYFTTCATPPIAHLITASLPRSYTQKKSAQSRLPRSIHSIKNSKNLRHLLHPLPCPLCFHACTNAGISSIAVRLFCSRPFSVRSHSCPFTFCPAPVPFTLNPYSIRRRSRSSVDFCDGGSKSSTPCCFASLTSSAWRRRE